MKMKKVFAYEPLCLNCRLCEVACKTAHSKSKDIVKAYRFETPEPAARVRVIGNNADSVAVQCRHCDDPLCVQGCITGAMHKEPNGFVLCDTDRCIGCMTCVAMCPFGAVRVQTVALKCDGCLDRETPACVQACPNRALFVRESEVDND
jgi:anaerobic carbon-monoxide dehydrogenase iron sulfur subunit